MKVVLHNGLDTEVYDLHPADYTTTNCCCCCYYYYYYYYYYLLSVTVTVKCTKLQTE